MEASGEVALAAEEALALYMLLDFLLFESPRSFFFAPVIWTLVQFHNRVLREVVGDLRASIQQAKLKPL